jgi:hypothetical protein
MKEGEMMQCRWRSVEANTRGRGRRKMEMTLGFLSLLQLPFDFNGRRLCSGCSTESLIFFFSFLGAFHQFDYD